jgi:hypothetical protein
MRSVSREEVLEILVHDLPRLLNEQPEFRYAVIGVLSDAFVRRDELHPLLEEVRALREDFNTEIRVLREDFNAEIRTLREDFNTRFAEHSQRMEDLAERLEEHSVAIRQLAERVEEHSLRLEEHSVAIRQLAERVEEHSLRLEEHSVAIQQLTGSVDRHSQEIRELRSTIGGLGARWGLTSEAAFRDGMAGILADVGLQVERFWQMDEEGYVFGEPDQVEIDVAVHDGRVILVEIRSSVSRPDVTIFQRKVEFYERVRGVAVDRRIIVSPMVDPRAAERARAMGIEVYTAGSEVPV